jgi:hypothetical protein
VITPAIACAQTGTSLQRSFAELAAQENSLAQEVKQFDNKDLAYAQSFNECAKSKKDVNACDQITQEWAAAIPRYKEERSALAALEAKTDAVLNKALRRKVVSWLRRKQWEGRVFRKVP